MFAAKSSPWRETSDLGDWNKQTENELRQRCKSGPLDDGSALGGQKVKILMFGLTQNGKSSLVNSMLCALTGKISQYFLSCQSDHTITRTLCSPHFRVDGKPLDFLLTDMPGIFKGQGQNADDYVKAVLRGHIKENEEVPEGPLDQDASYYVQDPQPFDRPCCVVLVIKAGIPLHDDIKKMFQLVVREATCIGMKVAVVLTHVDQFESEWERLNLLKKGALYFFSPLFPLTNYWPYIWSSARIRRKEVRRMFHSKIVHEAVKTAQTDTGISSIYIHPVVNYTEEPKTITEMNILHLHTLSKILDLAGEGAKARLHSNCP